MALMSLPREYRRMVHPASVLFCVVLTSGAAQGDAASAEISAQDPHALAVRPSNEVHDRLEVWVDLSVPPLSTLAGEDRETRDALRARITKQQDEVMLQLAPLGAEERGRVAQVRNAIAVRIPASALAQVRAIPGVVKVRVVEHRKRTP
jgi:hypothetical protein